MIISQQPAGIRAVKKTDEDWFLSIIDKNFNLSIGIEFIDFLKIHHFLREQWKTEHFRQFFRERRHLASKININFFYHKWGTDYFII